VFDRFRKGVPWFQFFESIVTQLRPPRYGMNPLWYVVLPVLAVGSCPFMDVGTPPTKTAAVISDEAFKNALSTLDIAELEKDLTRLMTDSQSCWPADSGHYGGLMIRLAWHCAGTFRKTDGKGGCAGGRIRFPPESDWMDNGNLAHARALLVPIKQKYGNALSWGDLMTFAGTVAIRSMGGPTNPHCFGRVDDADGSESDIFGTTQNWAATPCTVQGNCQKPLGAITVGLIYVNPEGPLKDPTNMSSGQDPDPKKSAAEIREVFGRMGMNDSETASLIAGGHAFGKCHGASGAGTMTSGFEGPWTTTPSQWSNQFLTGMFDEEWEQTQNPSGTAVQWQTKNRNSNLASTMRLTADLALVNDDVYKQLATHWICDQQQLEVAFAASWKKLVESGGGWLPEADRKCEADSKATRQQVDPNKNAHSICQETDTAASGATTSGPLPPLIMTVVTLSLSCALELW